MSAGEIDSVSQETDDEQMVSRSWVVDQVRGILERIIQVVVRDNVEQVEIFRIANDGLSYLKSYHPVLQDWVCRLPLRFQGTLLTAIRSCDTAPKIPGTDTNDRQLVAYLRYLVMNAADIREVKTPGAFMRPEPPAGYKPSEFGHYPQHFVAHLMHAFQVVAVRHPDPIARAHAKDIYRQFVRSLHLEPEGPGVMYARLTRDRIKSGEVVS